MKITHYIAPRASGKTTFAKELQSQDPENTLLFTMGEEGFWKWGFSMRGERWKRIVFDEYIFRYNQLSEFQKDKFYDWIQMEIINTLRLEDGELILISTPDRLYHQEEIAMTCLGGVSDGFGVLDVGVINKNIKDINRKFLNPFKVNIIKKGFGDKISKYDSAFLKASYSQEQFKINVEGEWLK